MGKKDELSSFFDILLNPKGVTYSILTSVPTPMIIADSQGKIRFINELYAKLIGCRQEDLLDKNLAQVRPGSNLQQVIETEETRTDILSKTAPAVIIDMSMPFYYRGQLVGGISFLKSNKSILLLHKKLEDSIKLNNNLSLELISFKNSAYAAKYFFHDLTGKSASFNKAVSLAQKLASYDADILITGESGTGKELFSQAIHNHSQRAAMPFIPVNCSTFTPTLIESELFGYEPNSFTNADKKGKLGLFTMADKGTIMFDEIGDLPFDMQAKLLRVLQERTIRKVGGSVEAPVDVRVIAATNKDLAALARNGAFREDLYYRLSMLTLKLPSLRERLDDIELLADALLSEWNTKYGRAVKFAPGVYKILGRHDWPGNIRELKNSVFFAAYTCEGNIITDIPIKTSITTNAFPLQAEEPEIEDNKALMEYMKEYERKILKAMLKRYGNSLDAKKTIANKLNISLQTLYNKLKTDGRA